MQGLWEHFRDGVRMILKTRGFTIMAVLLLALGVGAAMFQLLDVVRLANLNVKDPQQCTQAHLAELKRARRSFSTREPADTSPVWEGIGDGDPVFKGIFGWNQQTLNLARGEPEYE